MIKKALWALIAAAAIAAAASVAVVAAAFALYALLAERLGPAGAAASVAGLAALLVAIGALVAALRARGPRHDPMDLHHDESLSGRLLGLARQRPILAGVAAVAIGVIAFRNPKIVTALVTGMLAGKASPKN